jgi:hypothetical protein
MREIYKIDNSGFKENFSEYFLFNSIQIILLSVYQTIFKYRSREFI